MTSDLLEVPLCELDEQIAPLVHCLNAAGFKTIGSCQGGPGHAFSLPCVQIRNGRWSLDNTRRALCEWLLSRGVEGFTVRTVSMHQRSESPEPYSYVELELWDQRTLRYFVPSRKESSMTSEQALKPMITVRLDESWRERAKAAARESGQVAERVLP